VFWISGNLDEAFGWASARDTAAAQSPRRMPAVLWTPGVRLTLREERGALAVQELEQGSCWHDKASPEAQGWQFAPGREVVREVLRNAEDGSSLWDAQNQRQL